MAQTDIAGAVASNLTSTVTEYQVQSETTDGATGDQEYRYQQMHWPLLAELSLWLLAVE